MNLYLHNYWILIVEDDPNDRKLLSEAFKDIRSPLSLEFIDNADMVSGYLRHRASTTVYGSGLPEVILLDYYLPQRNADAILDELKSDKRYKDIPVIIMSGKASTELMKECETKGAIHCFLKPSDYDDLLTLARELTKLISEYRSDETGVSMEAICREKFNTLMDTHHR